MEYNGKCLIRDFNAYFKYAQISGNDESLDRWVIVPDINRPGLELTGYYEYTEPRRIVILGAKEINYIQTQGEETLREPFEHLTDGFTPAIVITHGAACPETLRQIAQLKNFPIFQTDQPTYRVMVDIIGYLDNRLSPVDNIHGVLMSVFGKGVLITGESGIGKSELALDLIRKQHVLIADDRVDVRRVHNVIIGTSPELLQGMLEIRGIGIINVGRMFGASALLDEAQIDVNIHLEAWDSKKEYQRVGNEKVEALRVLGIEVPRLIFPVQEGRNLSVLVESAVSDFSLKQRGLDSAKEFEERVYAYIEAQNKKNRRGQEK